MNEVIDSWGNNVSKSALISENQSTPKISVIVPVYKVEQFLPQCIESILNQTFTDFELLLINDGSPDCSGEICEDYRVKDSRVRVFHKENGGVSSARNLGLDNACGEWIAFVDSDDFIHPNFLIKLLELANSGYDLVVLTAVEQVNFLNLHNIDSLSSSQSINLILNFNFPTSLYSTLYNSKTLANIRLDEHIHFWEDFHFQIRVLSSIKRIGLIHESLYFYRDNLGSATKRPLNKKMLSSLLIPDKLIFLFDNPLDNELKLFFVSQCFFNSLKYGVQNKIIWFRLYCEILKLEINFRKKNPNVGFKMRLLLNLVKIRIVFSLMTKYFIIIKG